MSEPTEPRFKNTKLLFTLLRLDLWLVLGGGLLLIILGYPLGGALVLIGAIIWLVLSELLFRNALWDAAQWETEISTVNSLTIPVLQFDTLTKHDSATWPSNVRVALENGRMLDISSSLYHRLAPSWRLAYEVQHIDGVARFRNPTAG